MPVLNDPAPTADLLIRVRPYNPDSPDYVRVAIGMRTSSGLIEGLCTVTRSRSLFGNLTNTFVTTASMGNMTDYTADTLAKALQRAATIMRVIDRHSGAEAAIRTLLDLIPPAERF